MVDEPDVSYEYFAQFVRDLLDVGATSGKARVHSARQMNICLWILFVWARDVDNLEAPYRASELVLLSVWELVRPAIDKKSRNAKSLKVVLAEVIELHLRIADELLEEKVLPHVYVRHATSMSVDSQSPLDVNLALFETLGRIGLTGLWLHWLGSREAQEGNDLARENVVRFTQAGLAMKCSEDIEELSNLVQKELEHSTLQLWIPDGSSEESIYVNDQTHGQAICDLPLAEGASQLLETIEKQFTWTPLSKISQQ